MEFEKGGLPNEAFLVARLREGDEKAFRDIYNYYWGKQYDLAFYKLGVKELAEELTQEVFTALWINKASLDPKRPIGPYLYGAMKNQVLNAYRKSLSRNKYLQQSPPQEITNNTTEQLTYNELNEVIQQQMNQLPEKCREVFTLSRINGFNIQQIAEALDISPKTVNNHLVKALRAMRLGLKDYITILLILSLRR
jgi:RNA polymerase sigma-70 factor (ECF subfamily)